MARARLGGSETTTMPPNQRAADDGVFGIKIDYARDDENPGRIFLAMSHLIEALQTVDWDLANSIDARIEPIMALEEIQAGSVTTWLRNKVRRRGTGQALSSETSVTLERYLVQGKAAFMRYTRDRTSIASRQEVRNLNHELSIRQSSAGPKSASVSFGSRSADSGGP